MLFILITFICSMCYQPASLTIPASQTSYPGDVPDNTFTSGNLGKYGYDKDVPADEISGQHLDNNVRIFENDIMLTKQEEEILKQATMTFSNKSDTLIRYKRQAYYSSRNSNYFWQNGVVPYRFDSKLSQHAKDVIKKSMEKWESDTCITFVPASNKKNALVFVRGTSCSSFIGYIPYWKKQPVSVGQNCEHIHTIAHEIGHALGFLHTHTRADRDDYITIKFNNIQDGLASNFLRTSKEGNHNYGLPYDYGSVMHYSRKAFTSNNGLTIIPRISWYEDTMGSGTGPTFIDILMMNIHYKCLNNCKNNIKCMNNGYQHPRDCYRCLCPSGYGGKYCERRAYSPNCGGNLRATSEWRTLNARLGDSGAYSEEMTYCYWWIQARSDEIIETEIISLTGTCSDGCIFGGLELKVDHDKRLTGYRFCCMRSNGKTVEAQGPVLPVVLFNRKDYTHAQIRYRLKEKS